MKIFVGMDLASQGLRYYALAENGKKLKSGSLPWSSEAWEKLFSELGSADQLCVAFECSPDAFRARRLCISLGVEFYPFHAAHFSGVTRSKKKTDRIDAEKIARALRAQNLPWRVELPDDDLAHLRNLISERELMLGILRKLGNRARGMARQWSIALSKYKSHDIGGWWEEALEAAPAQQKPDFCRLAMVALATLQCLEQLEERMEEQIEVCELEQEVTLLQTIPGIGRLTAICLVAFLIDGRRFGSVRKAASYAGLVPSVSQTGQCTKDEQILGPITKEGPPVLRRLLVQAAQSAANGHQLDRTRWRLWFDKTCARRGRRRAIVALSRKLIVTAQAMLRDRQAWSPDILRLAEA